MFPYAVAVLLMAFALIAVRRAGGFRVEPWFAMLAGAAAVLALGQITPAGAYASLHLDILLFLFGMFVIGQALDQSGYLSHISHRMFDMAGSGDRLLLAIIFGGGIISAFFMKDAFVVLATPAMLIAARARKLKAAPLLLALMFGVTVGSVMSPVGSPQNLLIALDGKISQPFATFFGYLAVPTLINLLLVFAFIKAFYGQELRGSGEAWHGERVRDEGLALLSKASLALVLLLTAAEVASVALFNAEFRPTYIPLIACLPVLALSPRRTEVVRKVDWKTLVFLAATFVLTESVWETGVFQSAMAGFRDFVTSYPGVFAVSALLSQFISNIPLVALYLPVLVDAGAPLKDLLALAAGSTLAGNIFILGAASNIIVFQLAEDEGGVRISPLEFAKVGIPLTLANMLVYWAFISLAG